MGASDFRTDTPRLTGRTGLCGGLSFGLPLAHRFGSPRLFDAYLPDVLTTLTPTEFTGYGDWVSCKHRPSHTNPEARRLRALNLTRLIYVVHVHFGPSVLCQDCSIPSSLAAGQAPGRSVVNRLTRRMGLSPTSYAPFAGCCGLDRICPTLLVTLVQR